MIKLLIPLPPSANAIWRSFGRRVIKSTPYRTWIAEASASIKWNKSGKIFGPYSLEIYLPTSMRGDMDNRIKPINDLLQRIGIVENDKFNKRLSVEFDAAVPKGMCKVILWGL